jgi:hypothetical protein
METKDRTPVIAAAIDAPSMRSKPAPQRRLRLSADRMSANPNNTRDIRMQMRAPELAWFHEEIHAASRPRLEPRILLESSTLEGRRRKLREQHIESIEVS